jgi:hypothetical protein
MSQFSGCYGGVARGCFALIDRVRREAARSGFRTSRTAGRAASPRRRLRFRPARRDGSFVLTNHFHHFARRRLDNDDVVVGDYVFVPPVLRHQIDDGPDRSGPDFSEHSKQGSRP